MKEKSKKTWTRQRHRIIWRLLHPLALPFCRLKYNVTVDRFREEGDRAYLILMNHQTPYDQFFVSHSFRGPIYFMATEDIFSLGWISQVLRWLVAPIPIRKQTTDFSAVMTCLRVAREGGTIALSPEGNRTYSGKTEYINPAIVRMAKKIKLPIALYRIEGGYGAEPRWSDHPRKGPMHAYVSRIIEPEEYAGLSDEALQQQIEEGLYVNEAKIDHLYRAKNRAQYLERAIYVCPKCGLSTFESHGHQIRCKKCGLGATYNENKTLTGLDGELPFAFVNDWYEYQKDYVNHLDLTAMENTPLYQEEARLSEVIVYKHKNMLRKQAVLTLYPDRLVIDRGAADEMVLEFSDMEAVTVLGRNKLNIYHNKQVYQFKGSKRFNALKYVHLFYRYKNLERGNADAEFLGL